MAKNKLTVTTDVGTFTRTTARTYTHLVVVGPQRAEWLEERRQRAVAQAHKDIAEYEAGIADNGAAELAAERARLLRNGATAEQADEWVARIAYIHQAPKQREYLAGAQETLAKLNTRGTITADEGEPFAFGWCGRLDLARKLVASQQTQPYRWVRIYDVATGQEVRW